MRKLLLFLPITAVMVASGCVYQSAVPHYRSAWQPPVVWERPAREAAPRLGTRLFPPPQTPRIQAQRYPGSTLASGGGVRIYSSPSGIPATTRLFTQPSVVHTRSEDYAANPRYARVVLPSESRRLNSPAPVVAAPAPTPRREVVPPARKPLAEVREPVRRPVIKVPTSSSGNRLALATVAKPPPEPVIPPTRNVPPREQPSPPPTGELPFALPVPGRSGFARMPGHPDLPEIDVRGILPGTPVEVSNPAGKAGDTIQFRVP